MESSSRSKLQVRGLLLDDFGAAIAGDRIEQPTALPPLGIDQIYCQRGTDPFIKINCVDLAFENPNIVTHFF